jgi:PadR family transcriptional regulator PadR
MRLTHALVQLVSTLMAAPREQHWGYELGQKTGLAHGGLYHRLGAMLDEGWLTDGWESAEESQGRPARRYYCLTKKGKEEMAAILAKAKNDRRFYTMLPD